MVEGGGIENGPSRNLVNLFQLRRILKNVNDFQLSFGFVWLCVFQGVFHSMWHKYGTGRKINSRSWSIHDCFLGSTIIIAEPLELSHQAISYWSRHRRPRNISSWNPRSRIAKLELSPRTVPGSMTLSSSIFTCSPMMQPLRRTLFPIST